MLANLEDNTDLFEAFHLIKMLKHSVARKIIML